MIELGVLGVVVLVTTLWLTADAHANKVPIDKKPYSLNNGALAWLFSSLLLWIATFPYYLVRRSQVLRDSRLAGTANARTAGQNHDEIRRLKGLLDDRVITSKDFEQKKRQLLGAKPKGSTPVAFAIVGAVVVVLGLFFMQKSVFTVADDSGAISLPQSPLAPASVVTRAEYGRVQESMTYAQVREIIGAPGEELSRSDLAGITTVMYSWANSNGSNMNAMFQSDALVNKAQFGLE